MQIISSEVAFFNALLGLVGMNHFAALGTPFNSALLKFQCFQKMCELLTIGFKELHLFIPVNFRH